MQNNSRTKTKPKKSLLLPIAACVVFGEIMTLICVLLNALLLANLDASDSMVTVLSFVALGVGAVVTGVLTGITFKKDRMLMSLVCALILCIILVALNLVFFRQPVSFLSFVKYFMVIICTCIGAAVVKPKPQPKRARVQRGRII